MTEEKRADERHNYQALPWKSDFLRPAPVAAAGDAAGAGAGAAATPAAQDAGAGADAGAGEKRGRDSRTEEHFKKDKGQYDRKRGKNNQSRRKKHQFVKRTQYCRSVRTGGPCTRKECKFSHDVDQLLKDKGPDIEGRCYVFDKFGKCPFGVDCRWGGCHLDAETHENLTKDAEPDAGQYEAINSMYSNEDKRQVMFELSRKRYTFSPATEKVVREVQQLSNNRVHQSEEERVLMKERNEEMYTSIYNGAPEKEAKRIDFKNKTYLAPLTTVGNLPFRRVCKGFGVDITCGEMAVDVSILSGLHGEWALLTRHESEDIFGVQLAGGYVDTMCRAGELINEHCNVDFIDINCGCPIDVMNAKGAGAELSRRPRRIYDLAASLHAVSKVPITLKIRTGFDKAEDKRNAHVILPELARLGVVDAVSLHGRTRQQRYTKVADWEYTNYTAGLVHAMKPARGPEDHYVHFVGNGDVMTFEDYNEHVAKDEIDAVMVARGALIKPWLFTEIKEQRHWDISSHERFEMLRKFANYGLQQWGSDTRGVETTRRFLLEWSSFHCRYNPIGLLEANSGHRARITDVRPFRACGRDDMETLLMSRNVSDWIKLSEMLLGPVPDNFVFEPKHKARAVPDEVASSLAL